MLTVFLFIIDFIITGYTTVYAWNNIIVAVFGFMPITFWQGVFLSIAITYFRPKPDKKVEDWTRFYLEDIIYTTIMCVLLAIGVNFVGF